LAHPQITCGCFPCRPRGFQLGVTAAALRFSSATTLVEFQTSPVACRGRVFQQGWGWVSSLTFNYTTTSSFERILINYRSHFENDVSGTLASARGRSCVRQHYGFGLPARHFQSWLAICRHGSRGASGGTYSSKDDSVTLLAPCRVHGRISLNCL